MSISQAALDLRYPIGKFQYEGPYTPARREELIEVLSELPGRMQAAVAGLTPQQLDTPYRDGGWTVRQTVHHVAESHMHSFLRFRLAITENNPTIKPYDEAACANLVDSREEPVEVSLTLLDALHRRWVTMLNAFQPDDWQRTFTHPDRGPMTLDMTLGIYAWHSRHHTAHITELRKRMGW